VRRGRRPVEDDERDRAVRDVHDGAVELESRWERMWQAHERHHHHHHHEHHARWRHHRSRSFAEWRMAWKLRRRVFLWFGVTIGFGMGAGHVAHTLGGGKWWAFIASLFVLWMASGAIAWRLTRPLLTVVDAARRIGAGDLKTRIPLERQRGELVLLGVAINDMAARIEKQLADQRALLAAVSHELRTPLGHVRVLIETARDRPGGATPALYDELEREVLELDRLVDRLLASSRLDFTTVERRLADVGALAVTAVERAGVAPERLAVEGDCSVPVDPTLVRRALANLLENAEAHGGGAVAIRVERRGAEVAVEVDDAGPGVPEADRARVFAPFERGQAGGLGRGRGLGTRIASGHGGRAGLDARPGGGARAGGSVAGSGPEGMKGIKNALRVPACSGIVGT
jgi:signal transduction histidine kinase